MARIVRGGLIQATLCESATSPVEKIKQAMNDKHEGLIAQAAGKGAQVVCLQELFHGPYFCAEQQTKWYDITEPIPDGPTVKRFAALAKKLGIVLVLPIYEVEMPGVYYNAAAIIDADGSYLGKFRKMHIPQVLPGFWEKYYFRPGNLGYPVFKTKFATIGVYICYDRHFPEGARCLGLAGAEIVSIRPRRWRGFRSISGSSNSRPTRWRMATSSAPSTGPAGKSRGGSASSTDRATSAIREGKSWPRGRGTPTTS